MDNQHKHHFLTDSGHAPVVPMHWTIDGKELHEFIECGLMMPPNRARQYELRDRWAAENSHLDRPKQKTEVKTATAAPRRRVYGMT